MTKVKSVYEGFCGLLLFFFFITVGNNNEIKAEGKRNEGTLIEFSIKLIKFFVNFSCKCESQVTCPLEKISTTRKHKKKQDIMLYEVINLRNEERKFLKDCFFESLEKDFSSVVEWNKIFLARWSDNRADGIYTHEKDSFNPRMK